MHAGSFQVSVIHRILIWATWSLTCVRGHFYACVYIYIYTRGLACNMFGSKKTFSLLFYCAPNGVRTWVTDFIDSWVRLLYQLSHPVTDKKTTHALTDLLFSIPGSPALRAPSGITLPNWVYWQEGFFVRWPEVVVHATRRPQWPVGNRRIVLTSRPSIAIAARVPSPRAGIAACRIVLSRSASGAKQRGNWRPLLYCLCWILSWIFLFCVCVCCLLRSGDCDKGTKIIYSIIPKLWHISCTIGAPEQHFRHFLLLMSVR